MTQPAYLNSDPVDQDPATIGKALTKLLQQYPDIDLESIRIITGETTCKLTARVGDHRSTRCPKCNGYWHTPEGECIDTARPQTADPTVAARALAAARAANRAAQTTTVTACPSCRMLEGHTTDCPTQE